MVKFYICSICGNLIEKIVDGDTTPSCCGKTMRELRPESTDGALEKHVPVFQYNKEETDTSKFKQVLVKIGAENHPMDKVHHIEWIEIETNKGTQRKILNVGDSPSTLFILEENEDLLNIYAYCNLHGLYVKEASQK